MTEDQPDYDDKPVRAPIELHEVRCPSCHRIIAKVHLVKGSIIEIQCKACKTFLYREAA